MSLEINKMENKLWVRNMVPVCMCTEALLEKKRKTEIRLEICLKVKRKLWVKNMVPVCMCTGTFGAKKENRDSTVYLFSSKFMIRDSNSFSYVIPVHTILFVQHDHTVGVVLREQAKQTHSKSSLPVHQSPENHSQNIHLYTRKKL